MQFFLITLLTLVVTFLFNPVSKKISKRIDDKRYIKFHIHHSATGMLLFAGGAIIGNKIIMALGLGIYLGHVAEEIYFNKVNFIKAFFIFITR